MAGEPTPTITDADVRSLAAKRSRQMMLKLPSHRSFGRRVVIGAGLAAAALVGAVLSAPAIGADPRPVGAGADGPSPTLSSVGVRAFGTEATLRFTTAVPAVITVSHAAVGASPSPSASPSRVPGGVVGSPTSGTLAPRDTPPPSAYKVDHQIHLERLTSNTTYGVSLTATTPAGQRATGELRFTTLKRRVRVSLDKIEVDDDGDWVGVGEPTWFWEVGWADGSVGGCYPYTGAGLEGATPICQEGSVGEGIIYPVNRRGDPIQFIFAEENFTAMPIALFLTVSATESDAGPLGVIGECLSQLFDGGCPFLGGRPPTEYRVPSGKEWAVEHLAISAVDTGTGFVSRMYFTFDFFHDNATYTPNHGHARVRTTW